MIKNDYEAEYKRMHDKAATLDYAQTRAVHPRIERELGEFSHHHGCRRGRDRGPWKVRIQAFMTALVVNLKWIVILVVQIILGEAGALSVRGEFQGAQGGERKTAFQAPFSGCPPGLSAD